MNASHLPGYGAHTHTHISRKTEFCPLRRCRKKTTGINDWHMIDSVKTVCSTPFYTCVFYTFLHRKKTTGIKNTQFWHCQSCVNHAFSNIVFSTNKNNKNTQRWHCQSCILYQPCVNNVFSTNQIICSLIMGILPTKRRRGTHRTPTSQHMQDSTHFLSVAFFSFCKNKLKETLHALPIGDLAFVFSRAHTHTRTHTHMHTCAHARTSSE